MICMDRLLCCNSNGAIYLRYIFISHAICAYIYSPVTCCMKSLLFSLELGRVILVYLKIISSSVEAFSLPPSLHPPHNYLVNSHMPGSFLTLQKIWCIMNSIHFQPTKIHPAQCQFLLSPKWQFYAKPRGKTLKYVRLPLGVEGYLRIQYYVRYQYANNKAIGFEIFVSWKQLSDDHSMHFYVYMHLPLPLIFKYIKDCKSVMDQLDQDLSH